MTLSIENNTGHSIPPQYEERPADELVSPVDVQPETQENAGSVIEKEDVTPEASSAPGDSSESTPAVILAEEAQEVQELFEENDASDNETSVDEHAAPASSPADEAPRVTAVTRSASRESSEATPRNNTSSTSGRRPLVLGAAGLVFVGAATFALRGGDSTDSTAPEFGTGIAAAAESAEVDGERWPTELNDVAVDFLNYTGEHEPDVDIIKIPRAIYADNVITYGHWENVRTNTKFTYEVLTEDIAEVYEGRREMGQHKGTLVTAAEEFSGLAQQPVGYIEKIGPNYDTVYLSAIAQNGNLINITLSNPDPRYMDMRGMEFSDSAVMFSETALRTAGYAGGAVSSVVNHEATTPANRPESVTSLCGISNQVVVAAIAEVLKAEPAGLDCEDATDQVDPMLGTKRLVTVKDTDGDTLVIEDRDGEYNQELYNEMDATLNDLASDESGYITGSRTEIEGLKNNHEELGYLAQNHKDNVTSIGVFVADMENVTREEDRLTTYSVTGPSPSTNVSDALKNLATQYTVSVIRPEQAAN